MRVENLAEFRKRYGHDAVKMRNCLERLISFAEEGLKPAPALAEEGRRMLEDLRTALVAQS